MRFFTTRFVIYGLLLGIMGMFGACSGDNGAEQTLVALHATQGTEIAYLRGTATVEADRAALTLEYLATAGTRAVLRQREIVGTLNALNLDTSNIHLITPQATATRTFSEQSQANSFDLIGGVTRIVPTTDITPTIPTETPLATPDPDAPTVSDIVLSTGVGSNDCANGTTSEFTTSEDEIYVVMSANRLTAGNTVVSRWMKDGEEVAVYDFVRDFDVRDGACIWFFVDQSDFAFTAGSQYGVILEVNGIPIGEPVPFSVVEG